MSEWMNKIGIPTSRGVALVGSGNFVMREYGPEPGAILARSLETFIRFGTFEGTFIGEQGCKVPGFCTK